MLTDPENTAPTITRSVPKFGAANMVMNADVNFSPFPELNHSTNAIRSKPIGSVSSPAKSKTDNDPSMNAVSKNSLTHNHVNENEATNQHVSTHSRACSPVSFRSANEGKRRTPLVVEVPWVPCEDEDVQTDLLAGRVTNTSSDILEQQHQALDASIDANQQGDSMPRLPALDVMTDKIAMPSVEGEEKAAADKQPPHHEEAAEATMTRSVRHESLTDDVTEQQQMLPDNVQGVSLAATSDQNVDREQVLQQIERSERSISQSRDAEGELRSPADHSEPVQSAAPPALPRSSPEQVANAIPLEEQEINQVFANLEQIYYRRHVKPMEEEKALQIKELEEQNLTLCEAIEDMRKQYNELTGKYSKVKAKANTFTTHANKLTEAQNCIKASLQYVEIRLAPLQRVAEVEKKAGPLCELQYQ